MHYYHEVHYTAGLFHLMALMQNCTEGNLISFPRRLWINQSFFFLPKQSMCKLEENSHLTPMIESRPQSVIYFNVIGRYHGDLSIGLNVSCELTVSVISPCSHAPSSQRSCNVWAAFPKYASQCFLQKTKKKKFHVFTVSPYESRNIWLFDIFHALKSFNPNRKVQNSSVLESFSFKRINK